MRIAHGTESAIVGGMNANETTRVVARWDDQAGAEAGWHRGGGLVMGPYPREVAREVYARRPDLAVGDSIAAVLTADPTLTADEVIEVLDDASEEWRQEQEYQRSLPKEVA